ncbi:MAG TPA: helix-turn-helix transcriptional regulator [Mycobacteriales bacterium]
MDSGIGARVRAFRQWRRLSLRACAELAGIPHSTLSDIELGKYPLDRKSHIDALALALRVSPTELAGQPYPPAREDLPRITD